MKLIGEIEAGFARELYRLLPGNDGVALRPHTVERIAPIDDRKSSTGLEDSARFIEHLPLAFHLEEQVGNEDKIDVFVSDLRASRFFEIAPKNMDIVMTVAQRLVVHAA